MPRHVANGQTVQIFVDTQLTSQLTRHNRMPEISFTANETDILTAYLEEFSKLGKSKRPSVIKKVSHLIENQRGKLRAAEKVKIRKVNNALTFMSII